MVGLAVAERCRLFVCVRVWVAVGAEEVVQVEVHVGVVVVVCAGDGVQTAVHVIVPVQLLV